MGNGLPSRSDIPLKYRTELETWGINADSWGTVSGYESLYDNELAMGQSKEEAAQTVRDKHTEDMGFEDSTNEPDTEEDFKSCKGVEAPVATLANAPGPRRIKDPSKKQLVDLGCIPDVYAENILPRLHEYYAEHGWEVHSFDAMHGPYPSDPLSTELYPLERDMESRPEQHAFKDALQFVAQNDVDCILVGNSAWSSFCNPRGLEPHFTKESGPPVEETACDFMPVYREMINKSKTQPVGRVLGVDTKDPWDVLNQVAEAYGRATAKRTER